MPSSPYPPTNAGTGGGGGGAVTVADGSDVTQGTTTDVEATGNGTVVGILKRIRTLLSGSLAVTGTFWQATQPVSGTFWPATQPVSAASLPLPTGAAQDGSDITTPTAMPAGGVGIRGWLSAIWTKLNGSLAVTGTFFQATQPVSIAATINTNTGLTQPLTDTQLRATAVPVSAAALPLPSGASTETTLSALNTKVAAVAKGTQGSTGVAVQDLKDSGRSARTITLDSFAVAAAAETLMTMSYSTDNGTLTTGTSYTVTAGKRLRIQVFSAGLHTIAGNTTAVNVIVRVRVNNAGAATLTSPVQLVVPIQGVASANQAGMPVLLDFPDGWEFVAGAGIAVTVACAGFVATTAAPKVDITATAFEY